MFDALRCGAAPLRVCFYVKSGNNGKYTEPAKGHAYFFYLVRTK